MAVSEIIHIGENSPEHVAYKLFLHIIEVESRRLHANVESQRTASDREYILNTFAECMLAVKDPHGRQMSSKEDKSQR